MAGLKPILTAGGEHSPECMCVPCMNADMEAAMRGNGMVPALVFHGLPATNTATSERTRYAKPGQRSGNGIVRLVSEKQVKYMRYLLATRDTSKLVRLPGSEDIEGMSLAGARDLIDRLLGCPELPTVKASGASEAQLKFIRSLASERVYDGDPVADATDVRAASRVIDALKRAPRRPATVAAPVAAKAATATVEAGSGTVEAGMYRTADGTIYKVQRAVHGSGHLYAKRLVKLDQAYTKVTRGKEHTVTHEFEYASGAIRSIRPSDRMTLDQAREFGALYGTCCVCGRTLTDERSIEAAIGPVCANRL